MIKIQAIRAIALTVADIDTAQNFYTQALGFKTIQDLTLEAATYSQLAPSTSGPVRILTLQLGDEQVELIQYLELKAKPIPRDSQSNDLWFQDMAIVVSDMDRAYEHLRSFAITPISDGPQTLPADKSMAGGVKAFKFRDGDYHSLEILGFPEGKGKDKWHKPNQDLFLGIDHSAIAIADSQESLGFYRDLLGMEVADSGVNQGETQALLDGLPVAEVHINSLQPVQASMGIELLDYVKPGTGRAIPDDWTMSDLAHRHLLLETDPLETVFEVLKQQGVRIVSSQIVNFPSAYPYRQGCLILDPNGNALVLVTPPLDDHNSGKRA
ncbi:MAG: VOC family protein [Leptolyngbyaceae cyanobacterium]